jgi:hypothetical protein
MHAPTSTDRRKAQGCSVGVESDPDDSPPQAENSTNEAVAMLTRVALFEAFDVSARAELRRSAPDLFRRWATI